MTIPVITEEDLALLAEVAQDLDFDDDERRAVLLEHGSRDINAAPGSGKTTILAAKLLLLARKWDHTQKGICVLSHTNVAREEIQRRLGPTAYGRDLLAYPHFIGTIHGLVNQFLALPFLRSKELPLDVIDDDVFSRHALAIARANPRFSAYMDKNFGIAPMVSGLIYRGPNLDVESEGGKLPGEHAATRPFILGIKQRLSSRGIYRYKDMFAYAEHLLHISPNLKARLSQRFPIVFVDEMQDTSWEQECLLQLMFDDSVVIQRFGDVNQRILGSEEGAGNLTFPKQGALPISTSKRFGPAIATAVSGVQLEGKQITGDRNDHHAPMLMTYTREKIGEVISAFGVEVLKRFDDAELKSGSVKALCARKQGDAKKAIPGRTLLDYWPNFTDEARGSGPRIDRFWPLLAGRVKTQPRPETLTERTNDVRRAILMVLRSSGAEAVKDIRDGHQLMRRLDNAGFDVIPVRRLVRDLVVADDLVSNEARRKQIPEMLYGALKMLLPKGMTLADFSGLPIFAEPEELPVLDVTRDVCEAEYDGRKVNVEVGTIASMKGETHLATLVLESLGHPSRKFDLEEALPVIAELSNRDPKLKESGLCQYRNLYVGMSRPIGFLCLAVNAERVSVECKAALAGLGWVVLNVH